MIDLDVLHAEELPVIEQAHGRQEGLGHAVGVPRDVELIELQLEPAEVFVEVSAGRYRVVVDVRVGEALAFDDRDLSGEAEELPEGHAEQKHQERSVED